VSLHEGRFYLHVNVDYFLARPEYLRGVLLHEVHHVALGHLTHPKFAGPAWPELMELAIEMTANEHIEEPLPSPITVRAYTAFGVRPGQSTLERYDRLVEAHEQVFGDPREKGERVDDHRFFAGAREDGGGIEPTRRLLAGAMDRVASERGEPSGQAALLAGKRPGRLIEDLVGALGPTEAFVDWETALRMFVARARAPVHTYARPNRRFPERVGDVPGRTYSPRRIDKPALLVAIDTSMSMTVDELAEIGRQLALIHPRAELTIVECDTEIAREYRFTGALADVAGRGGTDLRPVFDDAYLAARRFDGVVYFTDGLGPFPDAPPSRPVLWILTKPFAFACPWGERALLTRRRR
jgi:predicted metal-dependent peptidase